MVNKLKLNNKFSEYLENMPEQGMGFQIVDIELISGEILIDRVILNSTYLKLEENENIDNNDIKSIKIKNKQKTTANTQYMTDGVLAITTRQK